LVRPEYRSVASWVADSHSLTSTSTMTLTLDVVLDGDVELDSLFDLAP
jgi:hypothetical protein